MGAEEDGVAGCFEGEVEWREREEAVDIRVRGGRVRGDQVREGAGQNGLEGGVVRPGRGFLEAVCGQVIRKRKMDLKVVWISVWRDGWVCRVLFID